MYTLYLTAKLDRPTFSRSRVTEQTNTLTNTLTNKQKPLKASTSLRYATPVGNEWVFYDEVLGTISTTAFVSVTRYSFSADYNSKEKLIATAAYAKLLSAVVFHATGRFTASLAKKLTIYKW